METLQSQGMAPKGKATFKTMINNILYNQESAGSTKVLAPADL